MPDAARVVFSALGLLIACIALFSFWEPSVLDLRSFLVSSGPVSYGGHGVVRLVDCPGKEAPIALQRADNASFRHADRKEDLLTVLEAIPGADLWSFARDGGCATALVRLNPGAFARHWPRLERRFSGSRVVHEDVDQLIREEQELSAQAGRDGFFSKYHTADELKDFVMKAAEEHPEIASVFTAGKTHEGRDILGLKIARPHGNSTSDHPHPRKYSFVFHGAQHAREWISAAVATYLADRLLSGEGPLAALLDRFEFHVIPVMNVDGYIYSWTKDRMWRKNRQPNKSPFPGFGCDGTDTNRNWGYKWSSSSNPCAENYGGPKAFSAPESRAIASLLTSLSNSTAPLAGYADFHAFSQLWMYPPAWTCEEDRSPEGRALAGAAEAAVEALEKVHGKSFGHGPVCQTIYPAPGSSVDFARSVGADFAFGVELRDRGERGFLLPPSEIVPSGEEVEAGLVAACEYMLRVLDQKTQ